MQTILYKDDKQMMVCLMRNKFQTTCYNQYTFKVSVGPVIII